MSTPCDLSLLNHNLCLIRDASSTSREQFTCNSSKTKLFKAASFRGKIWKAILRPLDVFVILNSPQDVRVKGTLYTIEIQLHKALEELKGVDSRFREALSASSPKPPLLASLKEESAAICKIAALWTFLSSPGGLFFPHAVFNSVEKFYQNQKHPSGMTNDNLVPRLSLHPSGMTNDNLVPRLSLHPSCNMTPLLSDEQKGVVDRFAEDYSIVSLMAILHTPMPIAIFKKICQRELLTNTEEETLKAWIEQVQCHQALIEVRLFHRAMVGIVRTCFADLEGHALLLMTGFLELRLKAFNCKLLDLEDREHLDWVSSLQSNETRLTVGDTTRRLGKKLPIASLEKYKSSLFECDDPSLLVYFGCNPATIGMWLAGASSAEYLIPSVKCSGYDPYFRFLVIERVDLSLSDQKWISKDDMLDPLDKAISDELVLVLKKLAASDDHRTPAILDPSAIFIKVVRNQIDLRFLKLHPPRIPFDFLIIEKFARDVAKGNRYIYRYLIQKSFLRDHDVAIFFREVLHRALHEKRMLPISIEANFKDILSQAVIESAVELIKALSKRRDHLYSELKDKLKRPDLSVELKYQIIAYLLDLQKESCYISLPFTSFAPYMDHPSRLEEEFCKQHKYLFYST